MARKYRLAYFVTHPIQYQAPLLAQLAAQRDVELMVFFLRDFSRSKYFDKGFGKEIEWDVPLLSGYEHRFLPKGGMLQKLRFIATELRRGQYDAVWLHGYVPLIMTATIVICKSLGMPVLLRTETHSLLYRSCMRRVLHWCFCAVLFRCLVSRFLYIGTLNREYYQMFGVAGDRLFFVPYAVDNAHFQSEAGKLASARDEIAREHGIRRNRKSVLFASKLQKRKHAGVLVEAFSRSNVCRETAELLVIGDGEEFSLLQSRVGTNTYPNIHLLGFKNQSELPRYYAAADLFALPSEREPWGLVINETMNLGTPVLCTNQVGAARDLVVDGATGLTFESVSVSVVVDALERALSTHFDRKEVVRRVSEFSYERDCDGILEALRSMAS